LSESFAADVAAIQGIAAVPTILDVVCRTTGMGFAAVARVTEDRWIACGVLDTIAFGLQPGGELKVETTICNEIRQSGEAVIIDHVAEDGAYRGHHTPAQYGFQSYISMPIVMPDGRFFGTLCAIDPKPAQLNRPEIIGMFKLFADMIAFHLDAHERLEQTAAILADERRTAELREQFIAVLGHDLRNPLASIEAGMRMILRTPLEDKAVNILSMVNASVWRMAGLIDNVLDFARGRMGDGIVITPKAAALEPVLTQVVDELRVSHPSRMIETVFHLDREVMCDQGRLGQLLSNLVGNALHHGDKDAVVMVRASTTDETFELSVSNSGEPIPPAAMANLFQPFERGKVQSHKQGLGLGLYIAAEIARAHDGKLTVDSSPEQTVFTFRMPLAPNATRAG
jgi:signal transduction histidine kinase